MIAHFMFSFIANNVGESREHRHETYQLNLSIDNPSSYSVRQKFFEDVYGIVIDRDTDHSCDYRNSNIVISYIYADSALGKRIKVLLDGKTHMIFPQYNSKGQNILPENYRELSLANQGSLIKEHLLDLLYPEQKFSVTVNDRVKKALVFIEKNLHLKLTAALVAGDQFISTVRLQHIFKEEIGMPLGQYILWKRVKKVIGLAYSRNMTLSMACTTYNFPDQAHFNHIFIKIFGVPPSTFLKSSVIIL